MHYCIIWSIDVWNWKLEFCVFAVPDIFDKIIITLIITIIIIIIIVIIIINIETIMETKY